MSAINKLKFDLNLSKQHIKEMNVNNPLDLFQKFSNSVPVEEFYYICNKRSILLQENAERLHFKDYAIYI